VPNRILTSQGWQDRIRDKVGVDDAYLTDASLQQPDVITVAEAKVVRAVPTWAALVDDDKVFLEAAVVCWAARQVITTMKARLPTRQKAPGMEVEVTVDWDARKVDLETEYAEHLGNIEGEDKGVGMFSLGGPQR
jgi:hypothetical protein